MQIVGAEYQPHVPVIRTDALHHILLLHHAAAQRDDHARILSALRRQRSQASVYPDIGIFPDGAGIVENKVRVLGLTLLITGKLQDTPELLRVSLIHLASEGHDAGSQLPAKLLLFFGYKLSGPVDKPCLTKRAVLLGRLIYIPGSGQHLPEFFRFKNCSILIH